MAVVNKATQDPVDVLATSQSLLPSLRWAVRPLGARSGAGGEGSESAVNRKSSGRARLKQTR